MIINVAREYKKIINQGKVAYSYVSFHAEMEAYKQS